MFTALALALAFEKTVLPNPNTALPEVSLYKVNIEEDVAILGTFGSLEACNNALTKEFKKEAHQAIPLGKRPRLLCINWG